MNKKPWQSWTLWFNVGVMILNHLAVAGTDYGFDPTVVDTIGTVNVLLRGKTKTGLSFK